MGVYLSNYKERNHSRLRYNWHRAYDEFPRIPVLQNTVTSLEARLDESFFVAKIKDETWLRVLQTQNPY